MELSVTQQGNIYDFFQDFYHQLAARTFVYLATDQKLIRIVKLLAAEVIPMV